MKLFADCADIVVMAGLTTADGFTTNPTLMRQAGVTHYETFARDALHAIPDRPISFEVIADTFPEMERQAYLIESWGDNAVVKIPITNTKGESSLRLVETLVKTGVNINVTAIMTIPQVHAALDVVNGYPAILSIFAGRIADTGVDPTRTVAEAMRYVKLPTQILWASARELYNVTQAVSTGCHIITLSPSLLMKLPLAGKDLKAYSLETVEQFYRDATEAGYVL